MTSQQKYQSPEELSDKELYRQYQQAKQNGPRLRLDELQLEIAQRWEQNLDEEHDGIELELPHEEASSTDE